MKTIKRFLAAVWIAALLLVIVPAAHADVIYPAPPPVEAGSELNHHVATVSPDAQIYTLDESFPAGVTLYAETWLDGQNIYLRGTPYYAGTYNCIFYVGETSLSCPLTVEPAHPFLLSASSDVICSLNDPVQLEVSAYVQDNGSLSYQWYLGQLGSGAVIGGNSPSLTVGTSVPGTSYYYCVVTNLNNGYSVSSISPVISVTVEGGAAATPTWISLYSEPYKTTYAPGETLDTAGLQLSVGYSDGSSELISSGFYVDDVQLITPGTQTVRVYYQGCSCTFNVSVGEQPEVITGIGVQTLPVKTRYTVGESLDTAGLTVRAYTATGSRDIGREFLSCSPTVLNTMGEQEILVVYGDKSCTFTVSVEEAEHPVSLVVQTMPKRIRYAVGESLDITGLVLKQISSRQNSQLIKSGYTCTPTQLNTVGRQQITVYYGNLSTTFTVDVTSAMPSASPSPSVMPSSAPTSVPTAVPSPTASAVPSPLPSASPTASSRANTRGGHQSNLGRSLIGVIVITALVALAILGVYVFVMNQGGLEGAEERLRELLNRNRKGGGRGKH